MATQSKVTVISVSGDNHLAVDYDIVLVEIVDMGSGQLRQIATSKFPGWALMVLIEMVRELLVVLLIVA